MKVIYLLLLLVLFPLTSICQDKELTRKEKKALKAKETEAKLHTIYILIDGRQFIIEIETVISESGDTYRVEAANNFFAIDSLNSNLQLSYMASHGSNEKAAGRSDNLGGINYGDKTGITINGTIDKYEIAEIKSGKPIRLTGSINNRTGGNSQFSMAVSSSGKANVTITDKFGKRTNFEGKIYSFEETSVFWRR